MTSHTHKKKVPSDFVKKKKFTYVLCCSDGPLAYLFPHQLTPKNGYHKKEIVLGDLRKEKKRGFFSFLRDVGFILFSYLSKTPPVCRFSVIFFLFPPPRPSFLFPPHHFCTFNKFLFIKDLFPCFRCSLLQPSLSRRSLSHTIFFSFFASGRVQSCVDLFGVDFLKFFFVVS